jgi:serine/threonine protein phosphatase 1
MMKHFEINEKGRDLVVGDIHGCFDKLTEQLSEIKFDTLKDRLFSVGDLVDRGEKSEECVKWLGKTWFHAVRGNHEQMTIDYINGAWDPQNYIQNGGAWLMGMAEVEQKCFVAMFDDLPVAIDIETKNGLVGIVHADCPVDDWAKLECELMGERSDLFKSCCLWDRFRYEHRVTAPVAGVEKIFVGHTIVTERTVLGNIHYIDTGAFLRGNLTVIQIN